MNGGSTKPPQEERTIRRINAFTLVELLVVISIIALLTAIMAPVLGRARSKARAVECASNLRQLGIAFACYANDYDDYAMPTRVPGTNTYWWGRKETTGIDHKKGFTWPYLKSQLDEDSVYECPAQRYGSYGLQGKPTTTEPDDKKWITSTYGYNGYYLSPPASVWESDIDERPWQKTTTVKQPGLVFVFADTLIDLGPTGGIKNTALLDPPYLYKLRGNKYPWKKNMHPTTCFRHNERTNVVFVDGHCAAMGLEGAEYVSPKAKIGSVGEENSPHYIPDWREWPTEERRHR